MRGQKKLTEEKAALVKREVERGNKVAVVVSAMAGETNKLVAWTNEAADIGEDYR